MEAHEEESQCSLTEEVGVSRLCQYLYFLHLYCQNKHAFHLTADDNATIRVTNLSEDTRETDLQELFRPFGSISRIYLAKDKNTGQSKVSATKV